MDRTPENPKALTAADHLIRWRLRRRREAVRMSQKALGEAIGVKYQQVQKYENGKSRIASSRLARAAEALGVPQSYFHEPRSGVVLHRGFAEEGQAQIADEDPSPEPDRAATSFERTSELSDEAVAVVLALGDASRWTPIDVRATLSQIVDPKLRSRFADLIERAAAIVLTGE